MFPRFVIDETGFQFSDESIPTVQSYFSRVSSVIRYALESGEGVAVWSEVWHAQSDSGRTLHEWLFAVLDIDRDVRILLSSQLDKVAFVDDMTSFSHLDDLVFDDGSVGFAVGIGAAFELCNVGNMAACITTGKSRRRGPVRVGVGVHFGAGDELELPVHFIHDVEDVPAFWRDVLVGESSPESEIERLSPLAFPNVLFGSQTWGHCNRFEGSFADIRPRLVANLSGLNDYCPSVWASQKTPAERQARMSALAKVDCSPESPQTHRNVSAMNLRRVDFGGQVLTCEWHAKLEPHRNRIHFAVSDGVVYVGIFADHLAT